MLVRFGLKNYKSYLKSQSLTMIASGLQSHKSHLHTTNDVNLLKFSALYGGNASGKSNFVDAIKTSRKIIISGNIPNNLRNVHFRLHKNKDRISSFEYELYIDSLLFVYGIAVDFSQGIVQREYLYKITPSTRKETLIYDIDYQNNREDINFSLFTDDDKVRIGVYIEDFKENDITDCLLITKIAKGAFKDSKKHGVKMIFSVYEWFKYHLVVITPEMAPINIHRILKAKDNDCTMSTLDLLKSFDTGISNFHTKNMEQEELLQEIHQDATLYNVSEKDKNTLVSDIRNMIEKLKKSGGVYKLQAGYNYYTLSRQNKTKKISIVKTEFYHSTDEQQSFSFFEESDGTRRLIELSNVLYDVQRNDTTYIIDELERSLHANVTTEFIKIFLNLSQASNSQLIVATHETHLMNFDLFRRDEFWFVNRLSNGSSTLTPLTEFERRKDRALEKNYLIGRYGAVPQIKQRVLVD